MFSDVPPGINSAQGYYAAVNVPYFDTVNLMYSNGLTSGCSSGLFCPDSNLTRAEVAIFLVRAWSKMIYGATEAFQTTNPPSGTPYFSDVASGAFGFVYIQKAYELGITLGCGSGQFCPTSNVTNLQAAMFTVRTRQLTTQGCSYNCTNDNFTDFPTNQAFSDVGSGDQDFKWVQKISTHQPYGANVLASQLDTGDCSVGSFCKTTNIRRKTFSYYIVRGVLLDTNN